MALGLPSDIARGDCWTSTANGRRFSRCTRRLRRSGIGGGSKGGPELEVEV
jgi:hypothetical protein